MTADRPPLPGATAALGRFAGLRAVVVGDVMLDTTVSGTVDRLSPEAPVPVLRASVAETNLGGAANVARQLSVFGARVVLIGVVGDDPAADLVRKQCAEYGIAAELLRDTSRPTTQKTRYLTGRQHLLRVDEEARHAVSAPQGASLLDALAAHPIPDVVVLSDHDKGVLAAGVCERAITRAQQWGVPILVDPHGDHRTRCRQATLVKANLHELAALAGQPVDGLSPGEICSVADRLRNELEVDHLVVTLGDRGLVAATSGRPPEHLPRPTDTVIDTSGAGDTVIATLALCLAAGTDLHVAANVSNVAAGLAVNRRSVDTVGTGELAAALEGGRPGVTTAEQLAEQLTAWRLAGLSVSFTNGCFDLLHPGHLALLDHAASLGDVLVVAVDSDRSVRALKGEGRPILPAGSRAELVAQLRCVDAVVVFDGDDLEDLVRLVSPNHLVKGDEYAEADIVGADHVTRTGGRVHRVPMVPGISTSAIVAATTNARRDPPPAVPPA